MMIGVVFYVPCPFRTWPVMTLHNFLSLVVFSFVFSISLSHPVLSTIYTSSLGRSLIQVHQVGHPLFSFVSLDFTMSQKFLFFILCISLIFVSIFLQNCSSFEFTEHMVFSVFLCRNTFLLAQMSLLFVRRLSRY